MYHNWEPSADSGFSGHIKLRLPTFFEKNDYAQKFGIKVNVDGEIDTSDVDVLTAINGMVEASKKHYEDVLLEKSDGTIYDSFDSMLYDDDCHQIYIQIATQMLNGFKPGNALKPRS